MTIYHLLYPQISSQPEIYHPQLQARKKCHRIFIRGKKENATQMSLPLDLPKSKRHNGLGVYQPLVLGGSASKRGRMWPCRYGDISPCGGYIPFPTSLWQRRQNGLEVEPSPSQYLLPADGVSVGRGLVDRQPPTTDKQPRDPAAPPTPPSSPFPTAISTRQLAPPKRLLLTLLEGGAVDSAAMVWCGDDGSHVVILLTMCLSIPLDEYGRCRKHPHRVESVRVAATTS